MDFSIKVDHRKHTAELFDERDLFAFNIYHMPYSDSYLPSKIFYTSIGSKILHIGRTITDLVNMVKCVVGLLLVQMKKQGIEFTCNISLLERMFLKHFNVFHNFADTIDEFIKSFFLFLHMHLCMYIFICLCVYVLQCIYLCCSF